VNFPKIVFGQIFKVNYFFYFTHEIEKSEKMEVTEYFGRDGEFVSRVIIEYDNKGEAMKEKQYIINLNGTIHEYEGPIF
jgi:hypothetical protein